jgi:hypothetical protein
MWLQKKLDANQIPIDYLAIDLVNSPYSVGLKQDLIECPAPLWWITLIMQEQRQRSSAHVLGLAPAADR